MTVLQRILIVASTAVLVQFAVALSTLELGALDDWRSWAAGVVVGCAQSAGVAVIALRTAGGLSLEK